MDKFILGVISDTHGLLRPEALELLKEADLIVHAGDVGHPEVLDTLRSLAPGVAVRGNPDRGEWARALPWFEAFECAKASIYVLHDLNDLDLDPAAGGFAAVISGHSHRPDMTWRDGILFLNPGSAGPRRFKLPVSVALIQVQDRKLTPELIELTIEDDAAGQ